MHDDIVRVSEAAAEVATSAMRAREPDGGLTSALLKQWWPDPEIREHSAPAVYMYVLMGLAFAAIEESQEHAVASETNPFMYTCLAWEGMRIPEEIGDATLRYHCSYALQAGYYLGRMRDKVEPENVLPGLVANCDVEDGDVP